jgi:hypothetical protein
MIRDIVSVYEKRSIVTELPRARWVDDASKFLPGGYESWRGVPPAIGVALVPRRLNAYVEPTDGWRAGGNQACGVRNEATAAATA